MQIEMLPRIDMAATGNRIRELRTARGIKVSELERIFNFTTGNAIYKWEAGSSLPTIENLISLSYVFDVNIEEILVIENNIGKST